MTRLFLLLFVLPFSPWSYGEERFITLQMGDKLTTNAEYLPGEPEKSDTAIVIIHGFLTTNQFHTVKAMASVLNDEGYAVLMPNLTLGISNRTQTLKCNSLHTHTFEEDAKEIAKWIAWLQSQGVKKVVLVGHSSGSLNILKTLERFDDLPVSGVILTSLFYLSGEELGTDPKELAHARKALASGKPDIYKYNYAFCKHNYAATPESFLSLQVDRSAFIKLLDKARQHYRPIIAVMGGKDKRYDLVGRDWLNVLKKHTDELVVVPSANHFFSEESEFDLQERLLELINKIESLDE